MFLTVRCHGEVKPQWVVTVLPLTAVEGMGGVKLECRSSWPFSQPPPLGANLQCQEEDFLPRALCPLPSSLRPSAKPAADVKSTFIWTHFPNESWGGKRFPRPFRRTAGPVQVLHYDIIHKTLAAAPTHFPIYLYLLDDSGAPSNLDVSPR